MPLCTCVQMTRHRSEAKRSEAQKRINASQPHHLHVVTCAAGAAERDAGPILRLRRDALQHVRHGVVRRERASGHERRPVARASLAAADTHPKERDALRGQLRAPPVGVFVKGVAAVDERIARGKMRREEINGFVDGTAGGDHQQNAPRRLQRGDEGGSVVVAGHVRCHACECECCECCELERA
jgi:hypothetical protein